MRVAVIGKGHTGSSVIECLPSTDIQGVYDSTNPISEAKLASANIAIVFVAAPVLHSLLPVLLATKIPVICGTTGIEWTPEIVNQIENAGSRWIVANNFSMAMTLIQRCLSVLGEAEQLMGQTSFAINEVHHVDKLDTPSGTAHSWRKWLSVTSCDITSERTANVKGVHQLQLNTRFETITLQHTAHDRRLFAQGAIWAADYVLEHNELACGVHQFTDLLINYTSGEV